jgi:hypothetical protein
MGKGRRAHEATAAETSSPQVVSAMAAIRRIEDPAIE